MAVADPRGIEFRYYSQLINHIAPQLALLRRIGLPERVQRRGVTEMRPKVRCADDTHERATYNMGDDHSIAQHVEPNVAVEDFKIFELIEVLVAGSLSLLLLEDISTIDNERRTVDRSHHPMRKRPRREPLRPAEQPVPMAS
ncbi:MAG: hypothetical protein V4559_10770 [Pseudomonadota bacterium]